MGSPPDLLNMDAEGENRGIALILELAVAGDVDPWDVDIVVLADQYLRAVTERMAYFDLAATGQVLLCLATLLRMKSEALEGRQSQSEGVLRSGGDSAGLEASGGSSPDSEMVRSRKVTPIEHLIVRRTNSRHSGTRRVTLAELIGELRAIQGREIERQLGDEPDRRRPIRRAKRDLEKLTVADVLDMAHGEFMELEVERTLDLIRAAIIPPWGSTTLAHLTHLGGGAPVAIFLSLLTLSAREVVELEQAVTYDEITVTACKPVWFDQIRADSTPPLNPP